jgi:hypothetical protein
MGARAAVIAATEVHHHTKAAAATSATSATNAAAVTTIASSTSNRIIRCLILISYPLQSPIGDVRDRILLELPAETDVLFISGDRDEMCHVERLRQVRRRMKARSWMVRVRGAGHGMDVKATSNSKAKPKVVTEEVGVETGRCAAEWLVKRMKEEVVKKGGEALAGECEVWWDGVVVRRSAWREEKDEEEEEEEEAETGGSAEQSTQRSRKRNVKTSKRTGTAAAAAAAAREEGAVDGGGGDGGGKLHTRSSKRLKR